MLWVKNSKYLFINSGNATVFSFVDIYQLLRITFWLHDAPEPDIQSYPSWRCSYPAKGCGAQASACPETRASLPFLPHPCVKVLFCGVARLTKPEPTGRRPFILKLIIIGILIFRSLLQNIYDLFLLLRVPQLPA